MRRQPLSKHTFLILITASSFMLASCTQAETVESSLQDIQSIFTTSDTDNKVHYRLSYDADFPCSVQLQESWKDSDSDWHHSYRFDLTDIESNTFVQSKNGRRAIIYGGYKISSDGVKKTFKEIRINNIRLRTSLSDEEQQLLVSKMSKVIILCEEAYSF